MHKSLCNEAFKSKKQSFPIFSLHISKVYSTYSLEFSHCLRPQVWQYSNNDFIAAIACTPLIWGDLSFCCVSPLHRLWTDKHLPGGANGDVWKELYPLAIVFVDSVFCLFVFVVCLFFLFFGGGGNAFSPWGGGGGGGQCLEYRPLRIEL